MKRARKFLLKIVTNLDIIAKTLLEVETLDAEQIKHLADHGTLTRAYQRYLKRLMLLLKISR